MIVKEFITKQNPSLDSTAIVLFVKSKIMSEYIKHMACWI